MPSGITDGSTATVPHPAGSPVAVVPSVEYAVAVKVSVPAVAGAVGTGASVGACTDAFAVAAAEALAIASMRAICFSWRSRRALSSEIRLLRALRV